MASTHHHRARLVWEGNTGEGTTSYTAYGRQYRVDLEGKASLHGTADVAFRGEPDKPNPEDLFLAAIAGCHMLSYLALCAKHGVHVLAYEDSAAAVLTVERTGGGRFTDVVLRPIVTVADAAMIPQAEALHERAHALCFIAQSCSCPIRHEAEVRA